MCGIIGVYSLDGFDSKLGEKAIRLLRGNKNRGQSGYGLSVLTDEGEINTFKFEDLNVDIQELLSTVKGNVVGVIGHARYPTSGGADEGGIDYMQPFELKHLKHGMAFAFNGNVVNAEELAIELEESEGIKINRPILDTNVLKHLILSKVKSGESDLNKILQYVNNKIDGACNIVLLSKDGDLAFSKDRWGFRPLSREIQDDALVLSSESSALFEVGGEDSPNFLRAGEIVELDGETRKIKEGKLDLDKEIDESSCFFESVYFADPKTNLWGKTSNFHRFRLGSELANEELEIFSYKNTIVIDIPSSSLYSAQGYSTTAQLKLLSGAITKNPISKRTFTNGELDRKQKIEEKYLFNPNLKEYIKGKRVVLIDDSIVRGSTMNHLVQKFIEAYEPSEVHLRIPSPAITSPCFYGINMASINELIVRQYFKDVNNPTDDELKCLAKHFGADSLNYISIEGLIKALRVDVKKLCMACINSEYPTEFGRNKYKKLENEYKC